jgi:glycosyltransferase involved in cell wall biosynthesis
MNLLISAYACAPDRGSDHAVGWTWVTEARRLGHTVWAMASTVHKDAILRACAGDPALAGIHWIFPVVGLWPLQPGVEPRRERSYNLLWQLAALRHAAALVRRERIDAIHHASWAGIRAPSFLGRLGPPLILGPIGGGETSTAALRDRIGARGRILEAIRDASSRTILANPIVRPGLQQAATIFVSTPETARLFRGPFEAKTKVFSQMSLQRLPEAAHARELDAAMPRFIYAGRLLYWKGVHIALAAFARLSHTHPAGRFTIVGDGPERGRLESEARALGVHDRVDFLPRLPKAELFRLYGEHDLMLFPSLHDSGGLAALEALACGLPVVCLALGGPGLLVTEASGLVVPVEGRDTEQVVQAMAACIAPILSDPARWAALSAGARRRAEEFLARSRAQILYGEVERLVAARSAARGAAPIPPRPTPRLA